MPGSPGTTSRTILGGRTPRQAAEEYVHAAARKSPGDPMIRLARLLDEPSRKLLKSHEEIVGAVEASSTERIAQFRFKVFGDKEYPDATFTPRLAFGAVKAYRDKTEAPVPYATTFGGMYHRAARTIRTGCHSAGWRARACSTW